MIKRIKQSFTKFSLIAIFAIVVFIIIALIMAITTVSAFLLLQEGRFEESNFQNPLAALFLLLFMSLVISTLFTLLISRLALKPIRMMLSAMKEMVGGNFDVRIDMKGFWQIKELSEYAKGFNETAKELGSVEILRTDFINNFSHEFKTPIVSLRGFAELLRYEENLSSEERKEYLDVIISESDRLAKLATNVLNLNRVENQTIVSEKSIFSLDEQVRRAVLMMESKWAEKNLEMDVSLGEINFYGNAELLSQVWINVLDNAVKFSPQDGKISIMLLNYLDSVAIKVQDDGFGMSEETVKHVYDKFYQGDTSHTTEGNGLGMAVAQKIVSLHNGEIAIESKPSQGSLITITLPKETPQPSL